METALALAGDQTIDDLHLLGGGDGDDGQVEVPRAESRGEGKGVSSIAYPEENIDIAGNQRVQFPP